MPKKDETLGAETAVQLPDPEEYVTFTAPFSDKEWDDDLFLSVNGENVRVMRGEPVKIKRKFVEVYENSEAQKRALREEQRKAKMAPPIHMG